jgi:tRNA A-37 threonylcarbamoyl transferase component Bud32/tetratricopeptide (TPR) repeat protein
MLKPGQKFDHFEILSKLGEGGMGTVYLARDTKLNRKVALKMLTGDLFDDRSRLDRFRREARTAAQISNAYVMATYDISTAKADESDTEMDYIVLEYVEGRSLTEYIKEERPELSRLVRLAEKIASGLAAAHKLNIVHRDIKPDNIIIDDSGDPKILDFGLAKPLDPVQFEDAADSTQTVSEELTKVGKIMGTVSYMSPEQVRGDKVDTRSDIFSFGILLYRMVTGDLPFAGPTQVETMAKILESSFEPPRQKNEAIPTELERIITKCLQKDTEDRYQSSRDLVVDLRNVRRQSDSGVTESMSGVTAAQPPKKPGRILYLIGGLVLILAAVAFFGNINVYLDGDKSLSARRGLQAKPNALAIIGFQNKTGDVELDWLETGLPEILLTDLSQNQQIPIISQQRILDCFEADKKQSHTHDESVAAADGLGATRLLSGAFYKLGEKIRIDARLEDVGTGNIVMAEKVLGDDPFMLVDSLTAKIAAALNLGETGDLATLASSPEAYKPYHLGMELFLVGEYDSAIAKFEEAIAIDSAFALPYMRIGLSHQFVGRMGQAVQYLMRAQQYQDRLPVRDRRVLDAYVDTWAKNEFDQAFTKLESLVRDYPDDAEIRTIYALFISAFKSDTVAAYAQFDTVLATYPTYAFALDQYAQILRGAGDLDRSAYYVQRLVEALPEAVDPQIRLILLRQRQGREAEALELARALHRKHPQDRRPLYRLISIAVNLRDFDEARQHAEALRVVAGDDPFVLANYYAMLANINTWQGKFWDGMANRYDLLEATKAMQDTAQVFGTMKALSDFYRRFEMLDSMEVWEIEAKKWSSGLNRIGYPLTMINFFPEREAELRPIFEDVMEDFRARLPRDFWGTADGLEIMFEAFLADDTARMIDGIRLVIETQADQSSENVFQLGRLIIWAEEYEEAKELLSRYLEGNFRTTNAWTYQISLYNVGRANEGLGLTADAIKNYREFLRYWENADIQVREIRDAKERLARLTS